MPFFKLLQGRHHVADYRQEPNKTGARENRLVETGEVFEVTNSEADGYYRRDPKRFEEAEAPRGYQSKLRDGDVPEHEPESSRDPKKYQEEHRADPQGGKPVPVKADDKKK